MRKIIVSNWLSLDGFIAGPKGELDWFLWDEETAEYSRDILQLIDTLLFGRVTYELMADYWPTATAEDPVITGAMNNLPKIVFSKTLKKVKWNNSRLVTENIPDEIRNLKEQSGRDMMIFGSGKLVSSLTQLKLIDEYRILLNPVVLGGGIAMFEGIRDRLNLKLLKTRTFACGLELLQYAPAT